MEVCLSVTLRIVDLWRYYVCCKRSDVTRCILFMCSTRAVCAGACYTLWSDRTSVHLCAFSLQNLRTARLYSPVSISVERPWRPRTWWCGTGGYQEQGHFQFIRLAARSLFVSLWCPLPFSSFILWVSIMELGSSDSSGVNHSLPAMHCQPFLIIITIIIRSQVTLIWYVWLPQVRNRHLLDTFGCHQVRSHHLLDTFGCIRSAVITYWIRLVASGPQSSLIGYVWLPSGLQSSFIGYVCLPSGPQSSLIG